MPRDWTQRDGVAARRCYAFRCHVARGWDKRAGAHGVPSDAAFRNAQPDHCGSGTRRSDRLHPQPSGPAVEGRCPRDQSTDNDDTECEEGNPCDREIAARHLHWPLCGWPLSRMPRLRKAQLASIAGAHSSKENAAGVTPYRERISAGTRRRPHSGRSARDTQSSISQKLSPRASWSLIRPCPSSS